MQTPSSFIDAGLAAFEHALHDPASPLRHVQLATLSPDGAPRVRTLVLRGFRQRPACVELHTDLRAGKVNDIVHCSRVGLLAWSATDQLQLRFDGQARLHHGDDVAQTRWDALSVHGRAAYGRCVAPGTATSDPQDASVPDARTQFGQFAVILVSLVRVDMLRLGAGGAQTRAVGCFGDAAIEAGWVGA